jgi:hypothetical protein
LDVSQSHAPAWVRDVVAAGVRSFLF